MVADYTNMPLSLSWMARLLNLTCGVWVREFPFLLVKGKCFLEGTNSVVDFVFMR